MRTIKLGSREIKLPRSRLLRIVIGISLVLGGLFWFLPIVGLWMLPLGLMVLAIDVPPIRRFVDRVVAWWRRRKAASE